MIKAPIVLPKLRFKGFSGEWEEKQMKDISVKCRAGGTPKADNKEYYLGTIPFLSISDINSKYLTTTNKSINEIAINNSSSFIIPKNNLLLSIYATIGIVCITKVDVAIPQSILGIILKSNFNLEFTYYLLLNSKRKLNKYIQTGSQPNLNLDNVNKINFKFPSLQEQTKIAHFFSLLDKQIELWENKLQLVELVKDYLCINILNKNLRFRNFCGDWKENNIKDVFKIIGGFAFPTKYQKNSNLGIPFFKVSDFNVNKNSIILVNNNYSISKLDLSILRYNVLKFQGIVFAKIGESCRLNRKKIINKNEYLIDNNLSIMVKTSKNDNFLFLYYLILIIDFNIFINDACLPTISTKTLLNYRFSAPSDINEQSKISYFLTQFDVAIQKYNNQIKILKLRQKHYLNKLFCNQ